MRSVAAALSALFVLVIAVPASAQNLEVESPARRVTLVELFTSEGCSSCPPAEAWMNHLTADPRLWHEVVPVAFHVDYWDYIGWPDTFAVPANARRQRDYHREGRLGSVYTPGLMANGEEWRGWFRSRVLNTEHAPDAGVLGLEVREGELDARFQPAPPSPAGDLFLNVATLGFGLTTQVGAGENAGRSLQHEFVVVGFRRLPMEVGADGVHRARGSLPQSRVSAPRYGVAAWVSRHGSQAPLQATGGLLSP
jgi:hypothetical protein